MYMYAHTHTHTHTHAFVVVVVICNIYLIYMSDKSLSRFRSDFFKKIDEVIYIINIKNILQSR
jgi:hypothetical protein